MATKTENELIADFIGKRKWNNDQLKNGQEQQWDFSFCDGYYPTLKTMKFQTSWDWLMPVVKKIALLFDETHLKSQSICELTIFAPIYLVYIDVVEFIKWYNQQKNG